MNEEALGSEHPDDKAETGVGGWIKEQLSDEALDVNAAEKAESEFLNPDAAQNEIPAQPDSKEEKDKTWVRKLGRGLLAKHRKERSDRRPKVALPARPGKESPILEITKYLADEETEPPDNEPELNAEETSVADIPPVIDTKDKEVAKAVKPPKSPKKPTAKKPQQEKPEHPQLNVRYHQTSLDQDEFKRQVKELLLGRVNSVPVFTKFTGPPRWQVRRAVYEVIQEIEKEAKRPANYEQRKIAMFSYVDKAFVSKSRSEYEFDF